MATTMNSTIDLRASAAGLVLAMASSALGGIVGFNESFPTGDANWRGSVDSAQLEWSDSGGPMSAAYVTSVFDLSGTSAGGFPATVIRASASLGSSDGAYVGNWLAAGVDGVSFRFRHDLAEAIQLSLRIAPATNFPGGSAFSFTPIAAGEWTEAASRASRMIVRTRTSRSDSSCPRIWQAPRRSGGST